MSDFDPIEGMGARAGRENFTTDLVGASNGVLSGDDLRARGMQWAWASGYSGRDAITYMCAFRKAYMQEADQFIADATAEVM